MLACHIDLKNKLYLIELWNQIKRESKDTKRILKLLSQKKLILLACEIYLKKKSDITEFRPLNKYLKLYHNLLNSDIKLNARISIQLTQEKNKRRL